MLLFWRFFAEKVTCFSNSAFFWTRRDFLTGSANQKDETWRRRERPACWSTSITSLSLILIITLRTFGIYRDRCELETGAWTEAGIMSEVPTRSTLRRTCISSQHSTSATQAQHIRIGRTGRSTQPTWPEPSTSRLAQHARVAEHPLT